MEFNLVGIACRLGTWGEESTDRTISFRCVIPAQSKRDVYLRLGQIPRHAEAQ